VEQQLHQLLQRLPALHGYPSVYLDGMVQIVEAQPVKSPAGKRPTCAFYNPSQDNIDNHGAIPMKGWAFAKHFPYGVCTNPQIVGPGGFGPCRFDNVKMDRCNAYAPDVKTTRGEALVNESVTILESGRVGQGSLMWQLRTHVAEDGEETEQFIGQTAKEEAIQRWNQYTDNAPLVADEPKTKPFLKDLVGVCRGPED
jgi:hypothetical protein